MNCPARKYKSLRAPPGAVPYGELRDECLNGEIFYSLKEAQVVIEQWRVEYSTRPSPSALGYRPPVPAAYSPLLTPRAVSQPQAVM